MEGETMSNSSRRERGLPPLYPSRICQVEKCPDHRSFRVTVIDQEARVTTLEICGNHAKNFEKTGCTVVTMMPMNWKEKR